jgi:hypothetical protein
MMLQIHHRESRDVDIFLSDPQLLPFLDPQTHDFEFQIQPAEYTGDGARFLKLAFDKIGEIDFIVGHALTSLPTTQIIIDGEVVLLETIPEIIAKKIYYRASSIKPRDIFDIAAAGEQHANWLIKELQNYPDEVTRTLATMDKLNPEFVDDVISQLALTDRYKAIARTAIQRSREILHAATDARASS